MYGYATIDWDKPFETWTFHAVSDKSAPERFGHGLGVGDMNGDGRHDILAANGWFEQPPKRRGEPQWVFHATAFSPAYGGAEMYAYDVDGDGDNDVITSLAAHDFGLAWYEQDRSGREDRLPAAHDHGQKARAEPLRPRLHASCTRWRWRTSTATGSRTSSPARRTIRITNKAPCGTPGRSSTGSGSSGRRRESNWVPYKADGEAGIGRQVIVSDINGDKLPDIVVGGMKGLHVLLHGRTKVSDADWDKAQPQPRGPVETALKRGTSAALDRQTGAVNDATEGEGLAATVTAGQTSVQDMKGFPKDRWSGDNQLFWSGGKPGERLDFELDLAQGGECDVQAVFTMARDYAVIQPALDGERLGPPLDLYNFPDVITTGVLTLGKRKLAAGKHRLTLEITGANPSAQPAFLVGVDYIRLAPVVKK